MSYREEQEEREKRIKKLTITGVVIGIVIVFGLILFAMSFAPVPKGENGCIFSNTEGWDYNEKLQGWHFKTPIVESMQRMSFQTQTLGVYEGGSGQMGVLVPKDKNGIDFNVDVTIRYAMDKAQICEFLEEKGRSAESLLVTALRADSTRGIFGKYAQEDIPENRIEIAEQVREKLQERINLEKSGALKDNFIQVLAVDIRNVQYNPRIEEAITAKQEAKQVAQTQEYKLEEAQKRKEIAIVDAEATQQKNIIEAEGRAKAILVEATAKAEGISKVNKAYQNMPPEYVEVKYAEALAEIAQADNTVFMDLGRFQAGNNLGIFDYNKIIGARATTSSVTGGAS